LVAPADFGNWEINWTKVLAFTSLFNERAFYINFVRLKSMFSILIATAKTIPLPFFYDARTLYSTVMVWVCLEVYHLGLFFTLFFYKLQIFSFSGNNLA